MKIKESNIVILALAGLISGSLSCSACIGGEDTDSCFGYKSNKQDIQPQIIQQKDNKNKVMPMYGVPEKPQYQNNNYIYEEKYGAPVNPKKIKKEMPERNMMLRYAPPMKMDK